MTGVTVMACFDNETNKNLMDYRIELSKILKEELAGSWIPHITLGCYELNDSKIKELIDWVEYLSSKTKVIEFKFNSIGTFLHNEKYPKTDVIYAAPTIPKKLYELYCDYHKKFDEYSSEVGRDYSMINGQPTIHSTITICNKNEYKKAIDFIWTNFKPMISKIKSIKIYKMNKELIKSVNLKGVD